MRKTHKKVLGFAGLGLVAAVTTVAAAMPAPVSATSSFTEVVRVIVENSDPLLNVTPSSGPETSSPNFGIKIEYDNIDNITATIVNKDAYGDTEYSAEILNENMGFVRGEKDLAIDFNTTGGEGDYIITITGKDHDGVPIEKIVSVKYTAAPSEYEADDEGNVHVDVDVPKEKVASIIVKVYDEGGNLVKTIEKSRPEDLNTIDLGDLDDAIYTLEIIGKDRDGNIITTSTHTGVVDKDGQNAVAKVEIKDQAQEIGRAVITITDTEGNPIATAEITTPTVGDIVTINLPADLPQGDYLVNVDYYNPGGEKFNTDSDTISMSDRDGIIIIGLGTKLDTVTTIETKVYDEAGNLVRIIVADRDSGEAKVYDKDGNLLFTVPDGFKTDGELTVPMSGLESGTYTAVIAFKNKFGFTVATKTIKIHYTAKSMVVPDTGGFFRGLNISREDYLITGLVVFMILGVVAFGIVARNKKNRK